MSPGCANTENSHAAQPRDTATVFLSRHMKTQGDGLGPRERFLFWAVVLCVPTIILVMGVRELWRNQRALTWTLVPARLLSCTPSVEVKPPDEDDPETRYSLTYTVSYSYAYGNASYTSRFQAGKHLGTARPSDDLVASLTRIYASSLGDGFAVRVNPSDPAESRFDPSLTEPLAMIIVSLVIGLLLGLYFRSVFASSPVDDGGNE